MHKQLSHEKLIMRHIYEDEKRVGLVLSVAGVARPSVSGSMGFLCDALVRSYTSRHSQIALFCVCYTLK